PKLRTSQPNKSISEEAVLARPAKPSSAAQVTPGEASSSRSCSPFLNVAWCFNAASLSVKEPTHSGGLNPQRPIHRWRSIVVFPWRRVNPQYGNGQTFDSRRKNSSLRLSLIRLRRIRPRFAETMSESCFAESVADSLCQEQCMTRSSSYILHELDPEIDKTLCRLRKVRNIVVSNSGSSNSASNSNNSISVINNSDFSWCSSSNINSDCNFGLSNFQEPEPMENNDRTLKELATPDVVYQPWCIQYPQLEPTQTYELKSGLIHLLPKFYGLTGEDPHKNLKEFHVICSDEAVGDTERLH
ncbi:hypothetical protein CR513_00833, partial [Mucuna pruriens]